MHSLNAVPFRNQPDPTDVETALVPDRESKMPIQRLLQDLQLEAEDVTRLVTAYEETLRALRLVDRIDPIADLVARKVIEIGLSGNRDAAEISDLAVKQLENPQGGTA
jgi:hypothetical protein